ncbi:MAG: hypothetical protein Q8N05_21240 [Bacteroidota bacterium]|nr:hypothetical protein [Bacteroidota bacterium]
MAIRTATDTCLLCGARQSDKTGSHYTPASIIKKVIGKANYEEAYGINAAEATMSKFMGRSNLNNTDPNIRKHEHMEDYIFCSECERRLGVIEGICSPPLNELVDDLVAGNVKTKRTAKFNKYILLGKVHPNLLIVYFYSILWRQCLQQRLDHGTIVIPQVLQDLIRDIVAQEIYKDLKGIYQTDISGFPTMTILTTMHNGDLTACFINPNTIASNPELFYIGPYIVLLWQDAQERPGFTQATGLAESWKDSQLQITRRSLPVIGVMPETHWQRSIRRMADKEAQRFIDTLARRITVASGYSFQYCRMVLLGHTNALYRQKGGDYITCITQVTDNILQSFVGRPV